MTDKEFWDRVRKSADGCWHWLGSLDTRGYGHLKWDGKTARAHRVAFTLSNGAIPRGQGHHGTVIMHTCDNRVCCNPAHLRIGNHAENMRDMKDKGRRKNINVGASNGRAKLTLEQVAAIRTDTRGKRTIAKDYNISPVQAQRVRLGQQWAEKPE